MQLVENYCPVVGLRVGVDGGGNVPASTRDGRADIGPVVANFPSDTFRKVPRRRVRWPSFSLYVAGRCRILSEDAGHLVNMLRNPRSGTVLCSAIVLVKYVLVK